MWVYVMISVSPAGQIIVRRGKKSNVAIVSDNGGGFFLAGEDFGGKV